jgi:hypothetical protein
VGYRSACLDIFKGTHQPLGVPLEHAMILTHHMDLLDMTAIRDSNASIDNVDNFLDPRSIAAKVV